MINQGLAHDIQVIATMIAKIANTLEQAVQLGCTDAAVAMAKRLDSTLATFAGLVRAMDESGQ